MVQPELLLLMVSDMVVHTLTERPATVVGLRPEIKTIAHVETAAELKTSTEIEAILPSVGYNVPKRFYDLMKYHWPWPKKRIHVQALLQCCGGVNDKFKMDMLRYAGSSVWGTNEQEELEAQESKILDTQICIELLQITPKVVTT
jgi:hypothetical protein